MVSTTSEHLALNPRQPNWPGHVQQRTHVTNSLWCGDNVSVDRGEQLTNSSGTIFRTACWPKRVGVASTPHLARRPLLDYCGGRCQPRLSTNAWNDHQRTCLTKGKIWEPGSNSIKAIAFLEMGSKAARAINGNDRGACVQLTHCMQCVVSGTFRLGQGTTSAIVFFHSSFVLLCKFHFFVSHFDR